MSCSLHDIAGVLDSPIPASATGVIEHLLTDSRRVFAPATSLFFALKSERRDGHQYIPELYKKGVRAFVVNSNWQVPALDGAIFFRVNDTLSALQAIASWHRNRFTTTIIGITGSNGKTIVKEWLYQLLHGKFSIVRSPRSYNSQIGVPLSIWGLQPQHQLAIFEAGISKPGEMDRLEAIIRPQIGVLTNIGEAHSEGFTDNRQKLLEKARLFQHSQTVVAHSRYDREKLLRKTLSATVIYCGTEENDDIQVLHVNKSLATTEIQLGYHDANLKKIVVSFSIPFVDDASIENAITCFATAIQLLPDPSLLVTGLALLEPVGMRMELKRGINNCYLVNDSYSNDLSSLGIALDYLRQQAASGRAIVILSDIQQSALPPETLYGEVARDIKARNIDQLIGIGPELSKYAALFTDIPGTRFFISTEEFLSETTSNQFRDSYILLKGARSFAFEQITHWLEQKAHQTVLDINLNAIVHNLHEFQRHLDPGTKVMAMVKAFAYGSGGAEIASVLQYHKTDYLGVAYADEGVELRKAGITLPIMVMNPEENSFDAIIDNNLEPEIYSLQALQTFHRYLEREGLRGYPVHIEIETGMNRLGFSPAEMQELATFLKQTGTMQVQSAFSHLAGSEDPSLDDFTKLQLQRFLEATTVLKEQLDYSFIRHLSNSAGIMRHPEIQLDMVRLGIGLYGINSSKDANYQLETVATLRSTIAQIKQLKKGESVSYNRKAVVQRDSVIATIRIGYADGYPRRLGNGRGKMMVNGKMAPVIGTVCMDMTMIDITDIPGVREDDVVLIFGKQLPVEELAEWANTIPYELMTGISQRVKRVYFNE